MTEKEIVQALRCMATRDERRDCEIAKRSPLGCVECTRSYIRDAAAAIERLTAENAALREKVPQWISVEERRPEPGVRVIATDDAFVGEAYGGMLGEWRRYDNGLCWFDVTGHEVTHWMPLPEGGKHE